MREGKHTIYLKVRKERQEYLGVRYFQFNYDSQTVVQVCCSPGAVVRRGKSNTLGVYIINRMTLFSNYMAMDYTEPCTKTEFTKKFNEIVKMLQP